MGSALGRLIVIDYNITKNDNQSIRLMSGSIDADIDTDPVEKANSELPYEQLLEEENWSDEDLVVRIVTVPLITENLYAFVHAHDEYSVSVNCLQNDMEGIIINNIILTNKEDGEKKILDKEINVQFTTGECSNNDCNDIMCKKFECHEESEESDKSDELEESEKSDELEESEESEELEE